MPGEPLRLFLLAHPKSPACQLLAKALMRRFVAPPASGGLRIPTRFTPDRGTDAPPAWDGQDGINLDASEHTLVVVLADARMVRTVAGGTGDLWHAFFQEGIRLAAVGNGQHCVFGMAVDGDAFALAANEHMIRLTPDCPAGRAGAATSIISAIEDWVGSVIDDATLQITVRAIQQLEPRAEPSLSRAPLQLFLSHAKADLSPQHEDPVRCVEDIVKELPIDYWFDAAEIPPSADFEKAISAGIRDCSIVVSFLTDQYSSRVWCQREVMDAKKLGIPVLVVDALHDGEPRHFPYIGNVPVVHWRSDNPKLEARRVVSHAARETLRFMYNRLKLRNIPAANGRSVLASSPEALTLAHAGMASQHNHFLYPDPPLAEQELDVLRALLPGSTFTTPLTARAQEAKIGECLLAVSVSSSDDLHQLGLCDLHEQSLEDEIYLYLLLSGCRIAYGGTLTPQFPTNSNFTLRLFEIVRSYSALARSATGSALHPIVNYAPWPLRLGYDDSVLNLFGSIATLAEGARPSEIVEADDDIFPTSTGERDLPADSPLRRLAWARGLTAMRRKMTEDATARIATGGRLSGFTGLYPGIFEEAWMSLVSGRPLFLVGAFGGASRAVIDTMSSGNPDCMLKHMIGADLQKCVDLAVSRGMTVVDKSAGMSSFPDSNTLILGETVAADFSAVGQAGIAASLKNGLSDEENSRLFSSVEPTDISDLILLGLSRLRIAGR